MTEPIAVVGMACLYPDARTPAELWDNVLAQRRAFRRMPAARLRLEDYWSTDRTLPDLTYATEAALIEGYTFDRVRFRVAGATFRTADLAHWLALDIAARALVDAGFPDGDGLPRATTGVLVGNTLTGEFTRANTLRLRWPYVRRVVEAALAAQGWTAAQRVAFLQEVETQYKAPFPPIGEESLAGSLSNTIAGRICNQFNLNGGGYTVDGACASSLLAIANACSALSTGDLTVALAGGVDLSLDPFELVGFAKTGALAPEEMRVYDARSNGFWPGEGCGFVVLMRQADAVAQQHPVYALLRGWGISSDGSGGITRPEAAGQQLALQRAYQRAGFGIETVAYFEGHGTGTTVGDATELQTLSLARRAADTHAAPAVISSIKANIGHTKAAAGVAGLIKAVKALQTQILPPTVGCQMPHPELSAPASALRTLPQAEPWPAHLALRAGVSAMGFGGINTHIVLEGNTISRRRALDEHTNRLRLSAQDSELFLFTATDVTDLRRQIERLLVLVPTLSWAEMSDLAATLQRNLTHDSVRAALVATRPAEFVNRLQKLRTWLDAGVTNQLDLRANLFLGTGAHKPRLGFLFPGQGAPVYMDGGALGRRFRFVQDWYAQANFVTEDNHGIGTTVAQPAIVTATVAALRVLDHFDLKATVGVGHSLGELSAYHWAGVLDEQALLRIAQKRGRLMAAVGQPAGQMAQLGAGDETVQSLFNGESARNSVTIACLNSPRQTVIAGESTGVAAIMAYAQTRGIQATLLPVAHAFHSPLMAPVRESLAACLSAEAFSPRRRPIVSTVTGAFLTSHEDLRDLLVQQVTAPVRFTEAITCAAAEVDLLIEVGPGRILSGLVRDSVETPVTTIDAGGASLHGLLQTLGTAFVLGAPVKLDALFMDRFTKPFTLDYQPRFFSNPCELAPIVAPDTPIAVPLPVAPTEVAAEESAPDPIRPIISEAPAPAAGEAILTLVRQLVAERAELPLATIHDSDRLLGELHLNSITVSQLVTEAARRLHLSTPVAPTEYAGVTIATVAQALQELQRSGDDPAAEAAQQTAAGIDAWVRAFGVELVASPPSGRKVTTEPGSWQVITPTVYPLAAQLRQAFAQAPGSGVVVCLPPQPELCDLQLLLAGVQAVLNQPEPKRFVLVQHGGGGAALARTLRLEEPAITTCVVDIPADHAPAVAWVVGEATTAVGYSEAHYDREGRRYEPVLHVLPSVFIPARTPAPLPLERNDVLLVTGGGKGITAECALALARTTGARLALIGRSQPAHDAELAANLARMRAAGVDFLYLVADVTQAGEVRLAVQQAVQAFGPITAILHGAARNVPQLLRTLDEPTLQQTLAPKWQGARNLLAAIDPNHLRFFVTFGSIIARTGLPGEADYGLANEWLVRLTEQFQAAHPACRCLVVEWSVWAGAGMGDRLGRLDVLRRQGIMPIPIDDGIAMLHHLFAQLGQPNAPALPVATVVSSRFGEPPTLRLARPELPFLRFLEEVRVYYPGVELVVDAMLSAETDPYLVDHTFRGERLLPAVMGLEAMAQVAMALAEAKEAPIFEDVRFDRPIVIPAGTTVTVRVAALVRAAGIIEVALRSKTTAFQVDHFRAVCRFVTQASKVAPFLPAAQWPPTTLDPMTDLYRGFLFHQGRFCRVKNYRQITAQSCIAELTSQATTWFGPYAPPDLILGDPGVRDAVIHAIQVCVPQVALLPIGVESLQLTVVDEHTPRFVQAKERACHGTTFTYDVQVTDADGRLLEAWQGLRLQAVDGTSFAGSWPAPLLAPAIERQLKGLWPQSKVAVALERTCDGDRQSHSDLTIQRALGQTMPVWRRLDGKPEAADRRAVSVAHAGALTLAVASPEAVGCDLEWVLPRSAEVWQALLGAERFPLAQIIVQTTNTTFDIAATQVWTAAECLKKVGAALHAPLLLTTVTAERWVLFSSGCFTLATLATQVTDRPEPLVVAIAIRSDHARL